MSESFLPAISTEDIATVRRLFEEYAASIETDLCFQNFSAELAGLPGAYAAPRGRLLLVHVSGELAGCVALRPKDERSCEMKRLYLRPQFQGRGLGRKAAEHVIAEARTIGYATMLLDTLPTMQTAIRLYESLGFVRRTPYYPAPATNIFMELRLHSDRG